MTELAMAVVSVAPTRRRRFQWAAWWSAAPEPHPFRPPDAHGGGARSRDEALRDAERAAGRALVEIEPRWARAWSRIMQAEPAWPGGRFDKESTPRVARASASARDESCWALLGVGVNATLAEIKRGYRQRALVTHPDRGGDAAAFRALQQAYERAIERRRRRRVPSS
jgi:hypothetical protein